MIRLFDISLVLVMVAASAVTAAPCYCAEMTGGVVVDAETESDAHDCCAGEDDEEEPAAPAHDCPHCATGTCGTVATPLDGEVPIVVASTITSVPAFVVAFASGEQRAPVPVESGWRAELQIEPDAWSVEADSQQDTYALNRVIRC